jgi:hypothetical protein
MRVELFYAEAAGFIEQEQSHQRRCSDATLSGYAVEKGFLLFVHALNTKDRLAGGGAGGS